MRSQTDSFEEQLGEAKPAEGTRALDFEDGRAVGRQDAELSRRWRNGGGGSWKPT